jgi:hypothetical protein
LDEVRFVASSKGIALLSDEYFGNNVKLKWCCPKGHEWFASPQKVLHETGCPKCAGRGVTIADMQAIAAERGGKCLSLIYLGAVEHHRWECAIGHQFEMTPNHVKRHGNDWCPVCREERFAQDRFELYLKELQKYVTGKGGAIVAGEKQGSKHKVIIRCASGHEWEPTHNISLSGHWCPSCAREARREHAIKSRLSIEEMRHIAFARGGACLSDEYVNVATGLRWVCSKGHAWVATPNNVKRGQWCPNCAGHIKKTVADMNDLAAQRGFQFLSSNYLGDDKHHTWKCKEGHQWEAKPSNIKQGRGCPECARVNRYVVRKRNAQSKLS